MSNHSLSPQNRVNPTNLQVGDVANVLYSSGLAFLKDVNQGELLDVSCGDTTVVQIKRNGSIVLANGYAFHKDGIGHKKNCNMVLNVTTACRRDQDGNLLNK